MAARLSRSKKAINKEASKESRPTELLDLLLGGNDFEDEEDETPSSTFTLG